VTSGGKKGRGRETAIVGEKTASVFRGNSEIFRQKGEKGGQGFIVVAGREKKKKEQHLHEKAVGKVLYLPLKISRPSTSSILGPERGKGEGEGGVGPGRGEGKKRVIESQRKRFVTALFLGRAGRERAC